MNNVCKPQDNGDHGERLHVGRNGVIALTRPAFCEGCSRLDPLQAWWCCFRYLCIWCAGDGHECRDCAEVTASMLDLAHDAAVRWRRYGKDRLYINDPEGSCVGWRDLITGNDHVENDKDADIYHAGVAAWLSNQALENPAGASSGDGSEAPSNEAFGSADDVHKVASPGPDRHYENGEDTEPEETLTPIETTTSVVVGSEPEESVWEDLATTRAGAAARKQARQLRRDRPFCTLIDRVLGIHTDERAWRIGADGEEKVATRLHKMASRDGRWHLLHAIPVGKNGSDIDHLVIRPPGVFTLNTKHHPKAKLWVGGNTFLVNGHYNPYIRNSRFEAPRAAKLLTAAIQPAG